MTVQEEDGENNHADKTAVQCKVTVSDICIVLVNAERSLPKNPGMEVAGPNPHTAHQDICRVGSEFSGFHPVEECFESETKIFLESGTGPVEIDGGRDDANHHQNEPEETPDHSKGDKPALAHAEEGDDNISDTQSCANGRGARNDGSDDSDCRISNQVGCLKQTVISDIHVCRKLVRNHDQDDGETNAARVECRSNPVHAVTAFV